VATEVGGRGVPDRLGGAGAEADLDVGDVGQDHQGIRSEVSGEQGRAQVLVDHRLGTVQAVVGSPGHGNPAAAEQMTMAPSPSNVRMVGSSSIARGSGDATTRRQALPSWRISQPRCAATRLLSASV